MRIEKNLPETKVNEAGQLEVVRDNEPTEEDIAKLENARAHLEKKIKEQDKSHRRDIKTWKGNIETQENKIEELKKVCKEKE